MYSLPSPCTAPENDSSAVFRSYAYDFVAIDGVRALGEQVPQMRVGAVDLRRVKKNDALLQGIYQKPAAFLRRPVPLQRADRERAETQAADCNAGLAQIPFSNYCLPPASFSSSAFR